MLIRKKVVTLFILFSLFSGSAFSQRIFYTEESTGKIKVGNLSGTSVTGSIDFITGLFAPRTIDVDFSGGRLYVGDVGNGDIKAYLLSNGQLNSLVISRGAMAEFIDFEYSENAGGIFASGNGEVPGIFFIPEDNQDLGNEVEYNMGPYSGSTYHSVAVDDGNERVYGGSDDDQAIFRTGFASGTIEFPNLAAINPGPMNFDDLSNRLYYIREGTTSDIYSFNPTLNTSTLVRSISPVNEIIEMQVSGKLGKIFFSVLGDGVYSLNLDGSGSVVKILSAPGSVYFDIEDEYIPPVFTILNPNNNATLVSTSPTLTMTFSENVQVDNTSITGDPRTIRIYRENGAVDVLHGTIDRASANITITNNIVTISGITGLLPGSVYYVLIGGYVFSDLSKNQFTGIVTPAGWTFQTVPPVVINTPAQPACSIAYTDLPNIVITESVNSNFKAGTNLTMIFSPPSGYTFQPGFGGVVYTSFRNFSSASISVLSNSITVTYSVIGETALDMLTIAGIKVTATSPTSAAGNITRTGGTGIVEGLTSGTAVASLTVQPVPAAPAITYSSGNNLCIGSDVSGIVISTTGTSLRWYNDSGLTSERTSIAGTGALTGPDIGLSSAAANTVTLYVNQTINGCTSPTATAAMTIIDGPTGILTSKTEQTSCASPNGSITVTGVGGGGTTGYTYEWADASLNSIGVTTTTISNLAADTYNLRVTSDATGCSSYAAPITIIDEFAVPSLSLAATPTTNCASPNGSVSVSISNQIGPITDYSFTWHNGSSPTDPVNPSSTSSIIQNLGPGTYGVRVIHIPTQCSEFYAMEVLDNTALPTFTPPSIVACETTPGGGTASINLTLYNSGITGGDANLIVNWFSASTPVTTVTASGTSTYEYRVRNTLTGCEATEIATVTIDLQPTTSNAGPDQSVCGATATLAGNTPVIGTGTWTISSGTGGSFASAASPTTLFTGIAGNTYTLRWTISNSTCAPTTDEVVVNLLAAPSAANAGADQSLCTSTGTLAGNTPSIGTGSWSIVNGTGGTITNPSSNVSTFSGTTGSTYVLRWTISNGSCTPATDEVSITILNNLTPSNAGPDQSLCGTTTSLAANTPTVGTGLWSVVAGAGGSFATATSSSSAFTGVPGATYTLRWTISNGPCTPSTDDVIITFQAAPTAANAGSDQIVCNSATLAGNIPGTGTGAWTIITGTGGTITNPASNASTFTGTPGSTYVLRWTVTNGSCTPSTDDVSITFLNSPTVSNAGPDQGTCGTTATLAANTPTVGTGLWTIVSGAGGFTTTPTDPVSVFNGVAGATYTLRWTITNGSCTPSTDDVTITFLTSPTASNAGTDQSVCATTATLAGNTPSTGTGTWTIVTGTGGTITNPSTGTSTFSGTAGSTYVLRWTIINGSCTPSSDDVSITFISQPTLANAGIDQANCGATATLQGNAPAIGTGLWSIISGTGGTIVNPSSPASSFTGIAGNSYTLRWTTSNSTCPVSTDDVLIQFVSAPSAATAGTDQQICGTTSALAANVPTSGTGAWSVVSGTGGSVANNGSATSSFTGLAGGTYTLRWTISNGSCPVTSDEVVITFVAPPTTANAGIDQTACTTTATLAANTPVTGTGTWTIISGAGGIFSNNASNTSTFTGVAGTTYVLRWSVTNGICTASTDDVSVAFVSPPTAANAGTDQTVCNTTVALAGNTPASGSGTWSVISGTGGGFSSATSPNSNFVGTAGNTYTLRWTISRTGCPSTSDDVTVQINSLPAGNGVISNVTSVCEGQSKTLTVSGFTNATGYAWQVPAGVNIESENSASITITTSGSGGTVSVTPTNSCGNGTPASAALTILPLPVVQINLPTSPLPGDQVIFSYSTSSLVQSQEWSFGDNGSSADPSPQYAYLTGGDYQVSLSVTDNNGCIGISNVPFRVLAEPDLNDNAIKNVITANGDEKNRYLHIQDLDRHPENEVRFLDRWGVEVFRADNYQNNWDARSGNGQFLPAGQYICVVRLKESGKVFSRTVSIIKGR